MTGYDWRTASELWHSRTGSVLFGWQERGAVFAGTGTRRGGAAAQGRARRAHATAATPPVFSCATAEGGRYVFAGDSQSSIYCFDAAGKRLWKLGTGCGSAYSMQYHEERLYIVTTERLPGLHRRERGGDPGRRGRAACRRWCDVKAPRPDAGSRRPRRRSR